MFISLNIIKKFIGEEEEERPLFLEEFLVTLVKTQILKKSDSDFRRCFINCIRIDMSMTCLSECFVLIHIGKNT